MTLKDNYNLFNLFFNKHVKIYVDQKYFHLRLPSIKDFNFNEILNSTYHIWTSPIEKLQTMMPVLCENSFDFVLHTLFQMGIYKEYTSITQNFINTLNFLIPEIKIDYKNKNLMVNDIIITNEIWEYILYLLRLSCGEKVEKPRTFASEDERQFYLAQKKMEDKIKKIKAQKPGDSDSLLKSFLTIQYKFNLSFEYLVEQTMAQIQWLQEYAAGAVSYEVNAQAFAAGNMKKGKKLDFFIK